LNSSNKEVQRDVLQQQERPQDRYARSSNVKTDET